MTRTLVVLLALGTVACARPDEPPPTVEAREAGPPGSADTLRPLLMARHAKDLPSPRSSARHDDAAAGLRWLAEHDDLVVVRARALLLLRHFPDADTEVLLLRQLDDADSHQQLRAAAVRALSGFDLDARADLRAKAAAAVKSPDLPVAVSAARVLRDVDADDLTALRADPGLPNPVRAALGD